MPNLTVIHSEKGKKRSKTSDLFSQITKHRNKLGLEMGNVCPQGNKCKLCRLYLAYADLENR